MQYIFGALFLLNFLVPTAYARQASIYKGLAFVNEWTGVGYGNSFSRPCDLNLASTKKSEALAAAVQSCLKGADICDPQLVSYSLVPAPEYTRDNVYGGCSIQATLVGEPKSLPQRVESYSADIFVNDWTNIGYGSTFDRCDMKNADQKKTDALNGALQKCLSKDDTCSSSAATYKIVPASGFISANGSFFGACAIRATVVGIPR